MLLWMWNRQLLRQWKYSAKLGCLEKTPRKKKSQSTSFLKTNRWSEKENEIQVYYAKTCFQFSLIHCGTGCFARCTLAFSSLSTLVALLLVSTSNWYLKTQTSLRWTRAISQLSICMTLELKLSLITFDSTRRTWFLLAVLVFLVCS